PVYDHQAEPVYVDADRQHVCRQDDVDRVRLTIFPARHVAPFGGIELRFEFDFELIEIFRNVTARDSRGEFPNVLHTALLETRHVDITHIDAVGTGLNVVFDKSALAPQLT